MCSFEISIESAVALRRDQGIGVRADLSTLLWPPFPPNSGAPYRARWFGTVQVVGLHACASLHCKTVVYIIPPSALVSAMAAARMAILPTQRGCCFRAVHRPCLLQKRTTVFSNRVHRANTRSHRSAGAKHRSPSAAACCPPAVHGLTASAVRLQNPEGPCIEECDRIGRCGRACDGR